MGRFRGGATSDFILFLKGMLRGQQDTHSAYCQDGLHYSGSLCAYIGDICHTYNMRI